MTFDVQLAWLLSVLLLSLRLGLLFFNTPFDAMGYVPARVKLMAVLGLSAAMVTGLGLELTTVPATAIQLAVMALNELVIGLAMAFGLYSLFAALNIAGRILDFQAGFSAANLFNPATNSQDPLIGTVLVLLGAMWFYLSGAYVLVIKGLAVSLQVWSPGEALTLVTPDVVVSMFAGMFAFGVFIAAPVLVVLYLIDTAVAVMARTMPQMNVYFLFLPLKIGVALVMTGFTIRYLSPVLERMMRHLELYWIRLMA